MPLHHRLRHYINLEHFEAKLDAILSAFRFAPAIQVLTATTLHGGGEIARREWLPSSRAPGASAGLPLG
jgi:hypothetical protein